MREGWHGEEYFILFDDAETSTASSSYGISNFLPGYQIIGLRSWDSFILKDSSGQTYSVPTVPLTKRSIEPFRLPEPGAMLQTDSRFVGKIKWYLQPLVFGGDPALGTNLTWVNAEQHAQLVKWWNDKYRSLATST